MQRQALPPGLALIRWRKRLRYPMARASRHWQNFSPSPFSSPFRYHSASGKGGETSPSVQWTWRLVRACQPPFAGHNFCKSFPVFASRAALGLGCAREREGERGRLAAVPKFLACHRDRGPSFSICPLTKRKLLRRRELSARGWGSTPPDQGSLRQNRYLIRYDMALLGSEHCCSSQRPRSRRYVRRRCEWTLR
jgi:hypothetical protein